MREFGLIAILVTLIVMILVFIGFAFYFADTDPITWGRSARLYCICTEIGAILIFLVFPILRQATKEPE